MPKLSMSRNRQSRPATIGAIMSGYMKIVRNTRRALPERGEEQRDREAERELERHDDERVDDGAHRRVLERLRRERGRVVREADEGARAAGDRRDLEEAVVDEPDERPQHERREEAAPPGAISSSAKALSLRCRRVRGRPRSGPDAAGGRSIGRAGPAGAVSTTAPIGGCWVSDATRCVLAVGDVVASTG